MLCFGCAVVAEGLLLPVFVTRVKVHCIESGLLLPACCRFTRG